ncbi:MAG: alginate lyase family protein [Vicinamibacterales bacterium]
MTRFDRLRRMGREEASWRARAAGRIHRDRIRHWCRPPKWDRGALASALAPHLVDPFLRTHLARRDWAAAQRTLSRLVAERKSLHALDWHDADRVRQAILARWPGAADDARARADRLLAGRHALLGYDDLDFAHAGRAIDWSYDPVHHRQAPARFWADVPYLDPACGDHKIIWELNRHQHWLTLGRALWLTRERRYGFAIIEQLTDWLDANPPLTGVNWASMLELAFRSLSWTWALHFLLADTTAGTSPFDARPWLIDLLIGLDRQLTHVERNLSHYFSPNTHLTGEALALYVVGRTVPELAASPRWAATGRDVLLREIETQIGPDGGHAERSMHYHRYTLDFYLLALQVAERSGDREAAGAFRGAVARLAAFARHLADDQGRLPMIGDDDGGMLFPMLRRNPLDVRDALALAAVALGDASLAPWGVPEEAVWLRGGELPPLGGSRNAGLPPKGGSHTGDGYTVIRDARGGHLVFDTGVHGFLNGGHAHADALAVTVTVDNHPLLIDPGTATYTMDPERRDRFRHSLSHNTLTLDGRSSSEPAGPFHWRTRTDARRDVLRVTPHLSWAEGSHDGYGAARHRRSIVHERSGGWLILDEVAGRGRHTIDLCWHFDPAWQVTCESKARLRATGPGGTIAWLLHEPGGLSLARGDEDSGLGWCAPLYGQVVPTWTARFTHHAAAPVGLFTWIAATLDDPREPCLERLHVEHDPGAPAYGVRIRHGEREDVVLLRPGDPPRRESRAASTRDYHTDARLLSVTMRDGQVAALALADGAHALALGDGLISVAADRPVDDLHVAIEADAIELTASVPPPRIQLQGAAVSRARLARLNGREIALARPGRIDTIAIPAAEWSAPPARETRTTCVA